MQYRKEIDGLRAIAVVPVILFHAGFFGFSGGYVGVDIFFVISGYLITSIILGEKEKNTFSIIDFYERRARRILPALSFVLVFSTIAAYVLMPADLLKSYSQSLASVMTFSSNIFFYFTSGYFSAASDEKPLLHTWSLAVEEQYYLFFPVMVVLLWSMGRKFLISVIAVIAIISLCFAQYLSTRDLIEANFYLIFSRAWELFFGSLIAFIMLKKRVITGFQREFFSGLGMAMIVYSIIFFDERTPFPSFYALVPVLGTCLIIVFADARSFIGRILSYKLFVFIGLISYSLYLWHQPLFAFLRLKSLGEPSIYMFSTAILLTFIFSFLSWKYVEKPFRNKKSFNQSEIFRLSGLSLLGFFTIGMIGHFYNGFDQRFNVPSYADSIQSSPKRGGCHTKGNDYLRPSEACRYFGEEVTWASFGDSHTVELAYALARKIEGDGEGLLHLSFSGCPPSLLYTVNIPGCTQWINESLRYLEESDTVNNVLLGFRYSAFLYGDQLTAYPSLPNIDPGQKFAMSMSDSSLINPREVYWESMKEIIDRLIQSGKTVYVVYPIPELPVDVKKAVVPLSIFGHSPMLDLKQTTSSEYYFTRNEFIIEKLDALLYSDKLHAIKPFEIICSNGFCSAIKDKKSLYFDDDHLSVAGSELIIESIDIGGSN